MARGYRSANTLATCTTDKFSGASISRFANERDNPGPMVVQEIRETRLRNLTVVVQECGGQAELAKRIDTDPSYISQLLNSWEGRGMGTTLARKIEVALGKPPGWMDTQHPELWSDSHMGKAAGRPLVREGDKSAQLTWLETEQRKLSDKSLTAVMTLVEHLRSLERDQKTNND